MSLPEFRMLRRSTGHFVPSHPLFPEISGADQQRLRALSPNRGQELVASGKQYNLFLGLWSQLCYIGGQVSLVVLFLCQGLYVRLSCMLRTTRILDADGDGPADLGRTAPSCLLGQVISQQH
jgi:hypothetical protein